MTRKASMISGIGTQYVAMLAKMLSLYCGATLLESYFKEASNFIQSERSEQMRCQVEHEKIKFIFTSGHVIFCLLYKPTIDNLFDDFPKISNHFLKISKDFPKLFQRKGKLFQTFFRTFSKNYRRFPRRDQ